MSDIREDLKAFVDGELGPARASEVEAALESNPELKREVEFLRALSAEIRHIASDAEVKGAQDALARVKGRRRSILLDGWILGSTGVAAILLVVANPLFSRESADQSPNLAAEYADTGVQTKSQSTPVVTESAPSEPATASPAESEGAGRPMAPKDALDMPAVQQGDGFARQQMNEQWSGRSLQKQSRGSDSAEGQVASPRAKGKDEDSPERSARAPQSGGLPLDVKGDAAQKRRVGPSATKNAEVSGPPASVPPKPAQEPQNSFYVALGNAVSFLVVRSPIWVPIFLFGLFMSWRNRRA